MTEETIFIEAIQKKIPAERLDYLIAACGDDASLRVRVEALLTSHEQMGDFLAAAAMEQLDSAGQAVSSLISSIAAETPGTIIGRYKLLQQIGEGGFGTVFLAEQEHPVRRKVALKIIKPGMDTKSVIARFEAERQALAMMDHPNIAKVFEAGATDTGRAYFVMELVIGEPITEHADRNHLTISQRLELFAQVCHAVQHAHQKGIIHRDIKPKNVLVSTQDGRPFAKVIDFGIAKAMSSQLTDKTLFTEFQQLVGTPQYMSPEQADGSLDIDTRTDIYSLGVLLYELLTGTTPFEASELRSAAHDEMRRIIREDEPPKPSTRLSQSTTTLESVAAVRRLEPKKLNSLVRGDLDWIVMKALEKDRARRYESPGDLAADVKRYLDDDVVIATPPSTSYQLWKLYRRHRAVVITGSAIAATILAALVVSFFMYRLERAARQQTELARQNERSQKEQAEKNFGLARDAVNRLSDIAQNRLLDATDLAAVRRDMLEDAAKFYEKFAMERGSDPTVIIDTARAHRRAAILHYTIGQPWEAEKHHRQAIAMIEGLCKAEPNHKEYQTELGWCYIDIGRLYGYELSDTTAALKALERAKELFRPLAEAAPENHQFQSTLYWANVELSWSFMQSNRDVEALVELNQALKISEHFAALAPDDLDNAGDVANVRHRMATSEGRLGQYAEAEADFRASISILRRIHAAHPADEWTTYNFTKSKMFLSTLLADTGRPQEGETLARELLVEMEPIAQRRSQYNLMATHVAFGYETLGYSLFAQKRFAEAHDAYVKSRDGMRQIYDSHPEAPGPALAVLYPLSLCPDEAVRDPAAAAGIARAALQHTPRIQMLSVYLGVSLYQMEDWLGTIHALTTAQQIGPKDLGFARYVLALAQFKSGQPELAVASLAQAEAWATATPKRYREPRFFATEARQVIYKNATPVRSH